MLEGQVVKLDRGYPLVRTEAGDELRCKHATALVKGEKVRAVIGDRVLLDIPEAHDKAIIAEILPRKTEFVRKDPTERALPQVLAANFDTVLIAQPIADVNLRRLERELVLAHETGADVAVILTKADLAESDEDIERIARKVGDLVGARDRVLVVSAEEPESIDAVRDLVAPGTTTVLIGKSGVGKSSLVNLLVGCEVQETAEVREVDGKGRHTTVSREMIDVPGGGCVVDMPGVRGLGLWDAESGIEAAFSDIEELAASCKFRDCRHEAEPGCAVHRAVEKGELSQSRLDSYHALRSETNEIRERREEASRIRSRTGHPRRRG
ncbi:ribosome small subunit-dependent GTPase A [Raoultibacter massiliensis]|uniref:ribosome small subunit-dependent GTPase A n=1 Tax=Raoultibacter massiliensis TaxID=1852371 RepID=UPI000C83F6EF|nr:ribosome small subunit-dependent GTPase A [Raoultibacter massiliensis]